MCAKNHLLIFSSFLDIWENVEWPRFFGPPCIFRLSFEVHRGRRWADGTVLVTCLAVVVGKVTEYSKVQVQVSLLKIASYTNTIL